MQECARAPAESAGRGTAPAVEALQTVRRLLAVVRWLGAALGAATAVCCHADCLATFAGRS